MRSRLALAPLFLALLLPFAALGQSEEQAAEPTGSGEFNKIDYATLADIDAARALRRNMKDNRPRHRISRYLGAAAEATDEGGTDEALQLLDRLNPDRLNVYERALVSRLRAFIAYTAGDTEAAIAAFRDTLGQEILQVRDDTRIRFNIAQLYAGEQKWPETIAALHEWFRYADEPSPLSFYLLAVAHFQQDQFDEAIEYAERAVDMSPSPREGWLQLLTALFIQKEDFGNAAPVLEELVLLFPKKLYWIQLSLIYGARENYRHSLAVQQVAYLQGLLTEDKELRRLARSYLYADLPYPAAKVLARGLDGGMIEGDAAANELLANSWVAAREYDESLGPLFKAATLSTDGKAYLRLGQVRLQREEWGEAATMFQKALEKGSLEKPGRALLLLGIASYNDGHAGPARSYFVRARKHEETRPQADTWIKHLDNEARTAEAAGDAEASTPTPPSA